MSLWRKKPTFYARVTPIKTCHEAWWIAVEANSLAVDVWLGNLPVMERTYSTEGNRDHAKAEAGRLLNEVNSRWEATQQADRQSFIVELDE